MSKYKVDFTPTGIELNFGKENGRMRFMAGELASISVDVGWEDTKICIVRQNKGNNMINIYTLKEYGSTDVANLLHDLVGIGRPEKLYLDRHGSGMIVKDKLIPLLDREGYLLTKTGDVIYDLDEDQKRFRSN